MYCYKPCGGERCGLLANHAGACKPEPKALGEWVYMVNGVERTVFHEHAVRCYRLSPDGVFVLRLCVAREHDPPLRDLCTNDFNAWSHFGLFNSKKSGRLYMTNKAKKLLDRYDDSGPAARDKGVLVGPW